MADARDPAERMAVILARHGMHRMTARVLCVLLFTEQETITAGEIAERLDVSPGSVSGGIKMLEAIDMVERAPVRGGRREHYRFPDDAWPRLMMVRNRVLEEMLEAADDGIATVSEDGPAGRRLTEMRDFYAHLMRSIPALIEDWRASRPRS
ncbi:GbsR/MarR family transcriptional regulator [Prauserella cavernicola]|uniref:MarR family transcriptional regulator n=1 Tax=Prauserella cavernicola TaxID=2800127 RepID=A0A934QXW7_9PSEU|nr:MarR family transcriptional regulator [Prauserella cavernicola]MBK1788745.1 MarR family transcriptional regulator [Prauserella cavernicola]